MRWIYSLIIILFYVLPVHADTIRIGEEVRRYTLVAPPKSFSGPRPTIFVLHGGGGNGRKMRNHFNFDHFAKQDGVLQVFPDGLNNHWNDGRLGGEGKNDRTRNNDIVYLITLAEKLIKEGRAKTDQIFVVGVSNGGMMTQRLLCESPQTFKAGVSLIAGLPTGLKTCKPKIARPILMINGDQDPIMPWSGGEVGLRATRGQVLSGLDTFVHWAKLNGCETDITKINIPDVNAKDKTTAEIWRAKSCPKGHQVDMIRVRGGGHTVPSTYINPRRAKSQRRKWRERVVGRTNRDFYAQSVIWQFLKIHQ